MLATIPAYVGGIILGIGALASFIMMTVLVFKSVKNESIYNSHTHNCKKCNHKDNKG